MEHTLAPARPRRRRGGAGRPPRRGDHRRTGGRARGAAGLLPALLLAAAALGAPDPARAQIGVMGGYSRDSLGGLDAGPDFSLAEESDGFHTGIFLDIGLGRFAVRPGIVYRRLLDAAFSGAEQAALDVEIVEFPLDLRLSAPLPVATPYLLAGPSLMFPSSARAPVDEALAGTRLRIDVGVGLVWDVGFRLWPEIRYGWGLGGLAGSAAESAAGSSSSLETLMVRIGVSF